MLMLNPKLRLVGYIRAIYRYPVKSMRGEALAQGEIGWRGLAGDRCYAFVHTGSTSGFPWLTARQYPHLVQYAPSFERPADPEKSPVRVRTPEDTDMALESADLRCRIARDYPRPVHLLHLWWNRTFDFAPLSLITTGTLAGVSDLAGQPLEPLRFRPNVVVEAIPGQQGFAEEAWTGRALVLGDSAKSPRIRVDVRDPRCKIVNVAPDSGQTDPRVLEALVRSRKMTAGVYGSVERPGIAIVGAPVLLAEMTGEI